jgi:hypothetical protein
LISEIDRCTWSEGRSPSLEVDPPITFSDSYSKGCAYTFTSHIFSSVSIFKCNVDQKTSHSYPTTGKSPEMSAGAFVFLSCVLGFIIFLMVIFPVFRYAILGIIIILAIFVAISSCCQRWAKKRNRSPRSLLVLPTSAQQAGDASDFHNDDPDSNTPSFTQDHGRGESVVLQLPPPAVIQMRRSNLGPLVTHPTSPTLLPMFMDGKDG